MVLRGVDVFDGREVLDVCDAVVAAGAGACEVLGGTDGVVVVDGAVVVGVLVTVVVCVAGTGSGTGVVGV